MGQAFNDSAWPRLVKGVSKVTPTNTVIEPGERRLRVVRFPKLMKYFIIVENCRGKRGYHLDTYPLSPSKVSLWRYLSQMGYHEVRRGHVRSPSARSSSPILLPTPSSPTAGCGVYLCHLGMYL